jgi:type III secretion protein C
LNGRRRVQFASQPFTNTIVLTGPANDVAMSERVLRELDRDPSHVVIEVLVVEFELGVLDFLGTDLTDFSKGEISGLTTDIGNPIGTALTFMLTEGARNKQAFKAWIYLLAAQNKARVISRPYMATLSGRQARINITTDFYVIVQAAVEGATVTSPQNISSGVIVAMTPTVSQDGSIRMDLSIEDSAFIPSTGEVSVSAERNKAETTVQMESGATILIGGLVLDRQLTDDRGIPWLRHVPILNLLFAKQQTTAAKREVMFLVTPHIWKPGMTSPLVLPDTFGIGEKEDKLTPLERFGR